MNIEKLEERLNELEDKVIFIHDYLMHRSTAFSYEWHEHEEDIEFKSFTSEPVESKRYVNKLVTQEDGTMKFMRVEVTE